MKQGTLYYDKECGRYNFDYSDENGHKRDYEGIHCGEMGEEWYLVGLPGLKLDGLEVRQR